MNITVEQGVVFGILAAAMIMFIWGRWRYDLVSVGALLLVYLSGLVPAEQAFAGFGHPAVITVVAVFILSRGLMNAGVVDYVARRLGRVDSRLPVQVAMLTGIVTFCSGFMNNVGALALLMPVAIWMSRQSGRPPSLLLMPLAFGSLLGGLVTLIGTPPNIIIASFRAETGGVPFGMFDFAPVGAGVALAGLAFISLWGWKLTPQRKIPAVAAGGFEIDDYVIELAVTEDSQIVGKPIQQVVEAAKDRKTASLLGLIRAGRYIPSPSGYETIQVGDVFMVETDHEDLKYLLGTLGLKIAGETSGRSLAGDSSLVSLIEVIIGADSPLVGETAGNIRLRRNYGINLLAVSRQGQQLRARLSRIQLLTGDILLLQGGRSELEAALSELKCLPLADRGLRLDRRPRIGLAVGLFTAAIGIAAINLVPVQISFLAAAGAMVLAGLVPLRELYESIDWPIIVLLGAMFPLGHALESSGGARMIAGQLLLVADQLSPAGTLMLLMLATMLLSNVINNAACAVLMAPIAINLARGMSLAIDPFLMAVAVGASCAFLTPVGHQSNAMVMVPGGYQFGDYWRMGLPLSILVIAVAVPLILLIWPV